jgi:MoaA/NifB/PqqE/SkfB family radical SAM enzyme
MDLQVTIPTSTLFSTRDIHIELSSKCTLKCPRCPRTELKPEQLNREISINEFKSSFTVKFLKHVNKIIFCGDVGDPIYAKDLLDIVAYIKVNSSTRVTIVTNGSYKDTTWWTRLGNMLTAQDQVTFSVDGWDQESNEQYRVNSDFASIVLGAKTLRKHSTVHMKWSAIYFNFNQAHVGKIKDLAIETGFDSFETVKSSKFGYQYFSNGVDRLQPNDYLVAKTHQYEKIQIPLTNVPSTTAVTNTNRHPWARCLNYKKELFINVDGLVFPCPWFNSEYQKNDFVQKYKDQLSIKTRTIDEILNDPIWEEFVSGLDTMPLPICKMKCKDAI